MIYDAEINNLEKNKKDKIKKTIMNQKQKNKIPKKE